jgi:hypothetical protein
MHISGCQHIWIVIQIKKTGHSPRPHTILIYGSTSIPSLSLPTGPTDSAEVCKVTPERAIHRPRRKLDCTRFGKGLPSRNATTECVSAEPDPDPEVCMDVHEGNEQSNGLDCARRPILSVLCLRPVLPCSSADSTHRFSNWHFV